MTGRGSREPDWPSSAPSCSELTLVSTLSDVNAALAPKVHVNDTLEVSLSEQRYPVVSTSEGRLGSITSTGSLGALVRCLRDEEPFTAVVLKVDGLWIDVRVTHA